MLSRLVVKNPSSLKNVAVRQARQALAVSASSYHPLGSSVMNTPSSSLVAWSSSSSSSSRRFKSTAVAQDATPAAPPSSSSKPAPAVKDTKQENKPFVPTPERQYEFFQNVEITDSGVAIIRFDCPGKSVNTISFRFTLEAKELWDKEIADNEAVKGVVFASAKPGMFIAGADIFDIQSVEDKQELVPLIAQALEFFQHWKSKGVPLVAAIDGPALGGGLEWALWCDYRICTDGPKTKLGLPEVKLGLLPGFGGTQNLHPKVGLQNAMDMMLTGKDIRPAKAKKMGLVDLVVAPASLESVAIQSAEQLAAGTLKAKPKKKSFFNKLLEDNKLGRSILWNQVQKMVDKNTNGNYPAPLSIIQCVQYGLDHPGTRYKNEREQFAKLAATSESEALIGIFDGMTQLKKPPFATDAAAKPVETVAVMGAGLMGAGIAQVSAEKANLNVLLKDRNNAAVARGLSYMQDNWNKKVVRKRGMTDYQRNRNVSRVTPLTDDSVAWQRQFGAADLVIEAVFEDLALKRDIVAAVEQVTPDHCIFATNTSAIPIADIAAGEQVTRPQNVIGMHYFSPVPSMPLLEIIPHEGTSDAAKAAAFSVGTKQGKTCILVKDVPGFYVNRCLGPYLVEVSALVRDGVPLKKLDEAVKKFGMPVGPITLADEVGLDVAGHVAKFLSEADLGVRMEGGDVSLMQNMIDKGWLGKKSGQGFYTYKGKKKTIDPAVQKYVDEFATQKLQLSETEIQDRIVSRFVNEAAKCLEDEIIADPVVGDIGLVFGTGFAPFRGGPFRYLDQVGVAQYVDTMNRLTDTYGPQFEPCQLLKDHAASGKKFHST